MRGQRGSGFRKCSCKGGAMPPLQKIMRQPKASPPQWGGGAKRRWGTPFRTATLLAAPQSRGGLQPKPLGTSSLRAGCGGVKLRVLRAGRQKEPFLGSSPRNCFGKGAGERIYSQRWGRPARVGIAQMLLQGRRCAARRGMKTFIVKARRPHPSRLCRATGACRPGLVENSPPDCFPGTAAPIGEGFGGSPAPLPQKLVPMGNISLEIPLERMYYI